METNKMALKVTNVLGFKLVSNWYHAIINCRY